MKIIKTICIGVTAALSSLPAFAQQTYEELEQLTVNEQVTTVITASEPIRFVDISTDKVVGDQPINNTIRLKPKETGHEDGEVCLLYTSKWNHCHSTRSMSSLYSAFPTSAMKTV